MRSEIIVDTTLMRSGFCDRLRQITFAFLLSKFSKKKKFYILEKKTDECPFLFTDHCNIKKIKIRKIQKYKKNKVIIRMSSYDSDININTIKKYLPHTNKSINYEKVLNKWKSSYREIYLNKNIQKKIKNLKLPSKYVGVHIRATDKLVSLFTKLFELPSKTTILNSQLNLFIKNLDKKIYLNTNVKNVYLSCDDKNIKKLTLNLLQKKGFNVFFNESKFLGNKLRQTSGEDFLIDLFCLSASKIIISSTGGGVPLTASLISRKKIVVKNFLDELNIFYLLKIFNKFIFYLRKIIK